MKKNKIINIVSVFFSFIFMVNLIGCYNHGSNIGSNEKVDKKRTQLYIYNFDGGYGSFWLDALKKRYECLHKEDIYEEGKKGIQIYVTNKKENITSEQILENKDEVYFTEYRYYYTMLAEGVLGDITQAVTTDLGEYGDSKGKTIEDKLSEDQKAFYGLKKEDNTYYYGIPHYSGFSGFIYNVDLFNEKCYFFADEPGEIFSYEDRFIQTLSEKKSAGPDGVYDTYDDGLPSTYEEFFMLCDYIASDGNIPVQWTGANYKDYLSNLLQALVAQEEGSEQMMLNFKIQGNAKTLGVIKNNDFIEDDLDKTIDNSNGYELSRQKGKYNALKFLYKLISTDKYHNRLAFNNGYSHMNSQEDFLYAGHDGGVTSPVGILCDGIWWEEEATNTFNEMTDAKGKEFSKKERSFSFMPLPYSTNRTNVKNSLYDHIYSLCFMKSNIAEWKKPIALDFIRYANTDESLIEFTQITNTPKALSYSMTDSEMQEMTDFGRSVIKLKNDSDIIYPYSTNNFYVNNQSSFSVSNLYHSIIKNLEKTWPAEAFHDNAVTPEEYFSGMYTYWKNSWHLLYN